MVKAQGAGSAEDKPSIKIKLGGKDVGTTRKDMGGPPKLKIKLPSAKIEPLEPIKAEESHKPAQEKPAKRARKRKAPSPDEVAPSVGQPCTYSEIELFTILLSSVSLTESRPVWEELQRLPDFVE